MPARKAAVVGEALANPAALTADDFRVTLNESEVGWVWSLDKQSGIYPVRELLHRLACPRRPLAVDLMGIATDAFQLTLQVAHKAWRLAAFIRLGRNFHVLANAARRQKDGCSLGVFRRLGAFCWPVGACFDDARKNRTLVELLSALRSAVP